MQSEHRLHPVSLLFGLWGSVKALALPATLFIFSSLRGGGDEPALPGAGPLNRFGMPDMEGWQVWALLFAILAMLNTVVQYLRFRITYEGTELVIRSGFLVRNERHVPYDRIQNLDATRNIFHRLFSVADVRVETGGGTEPEARISVLHETAFEEMRRRVFAARAASPPAHRDAGEPSGVAAAATASPLLHLPTRELILLGAVENRGMLMLAAAYGVLWELGWQDALWRRLTGSTYALGAFSDLWARLSEGQLPQLRELAVIATGAVALLVFVRILSMIWVSVTLHDFRLTRVGDDLRTEYGLLTRVTTTIPRRRIQTITVYATPLQRWLGRASVRVETAGAGTSPQEGGRGFQRERLAPIVRETAVNDLVRSLMPVCDPDRLVWEPLHPRAFRRAIKPMLLLVGLASASLLLVHWRLSVLIPVAIAAAIVVARKQVQHFGWAMDAETVAIKTGWLWRRVTIAPLVRIQSVSTTESPFDRRAGMATVAIDTAGGQALSRVRIPYLARPVADDVSMRLAAAAAETAFRW